MKRIITNEEVDFRGNQIAERLESGMAFYGVPRGGIAPAYLIAGVTQGSIVNTPSKADYIIDDLIDSGSTRDRYTKLYPTTPFIALFEKTDPMEWLVFPWEITDSGRDVSAEDIPSRFLEFIGEDLTRDGLKETPKRMIKAWKEIFSGYEQNPSDVIKTFESDGYDQIVLLRDIELYSMCEHHALPFVGRAHVAYIPGGRVIGISKLARLIDIFSKRLQIQERIGDQVTSILMNELNAQGAACIIEADHFCIRMRGVGKQHSTMVTSSMKGVFLTKPEARSELLSLIRS